MEENRTERNGTAEAGEELNKFLEEREKNSHFLSQLKNPIHFCENF